MKPDAPSPAIGPASTSALLANAPAGSHFAQLHQTPESLARYVGRFVAAGLERGDRVLMIATPFHTKLILRTLEAFACDTATAQAAGELIVLDAEWTLRQIMVGDSPAWPLFERIALNVLRRGNGPSERSTRVYGEMVGLLWQRGNQAAAIQLEQFWDRLQREQSFALFCCYLLDRWKLECYESPLQQIGKLHSALIPTDDDERFAEAVAIAAKEVLGDLNVRADDPVGAGLPEGIRRVLYIKRLMPAATASVLSRARRLFGA